jgi:hypothetical protein
MAVNIVTRQTGSYAKNSTLTNTELDTNFINLKDAVDNVNVNIENTKSSIRPSLLLDFSNLKRLDKRITFTRASIGTRYNADGLLEKVEAGKPRFDHDPVTKESLGLLIEEQRTNLLSYSEKAVGNPVRASKILNSAIAPDGTMTALKLINDTSASADHFIGYGLMSSTTANAVNTASVYAKASEYSRFTVDICDSTDYITTRLRTYVNLSTVTAAVTIGSGSTTITPVGNGWYRVSVSGQAKNGSAGAVDLIITLANNSGQQAYTGDGASGLYLWGAQLEVGAFATSYIPSNDTFTSRASTATYIGSDGLVKTSAINTARYNYNPMNLKLAPKLLLEPAATNLLIYSEQFDNTLSWQAANVSVTPNAAIAPDGTMTADMITDTSATVEGLIAVNLDITANDGITRTFSCFVKAGTATKPVVWMGYYNGTSWPSSGAILNTDGSVAYVGEGAYSITPYPNNWYRISVTLKNTLAGAYLLNCRIQSEYWGLGGVGVGNYYVWGAQLEVGTTATSYIPTTSSQVTRSADASSSGQYTRLADSAEMLTSTWFNKDEGSFLTALSNVSNPAGSIVMVDKGLNSWGGRIQMSMNSSLTVVQTNIVNDAGGVDVQLGNTGLKTVFAYKTNDCANSANGSITATDSSATLPTSLTKMHIGKSPASNYILDGTLAKLAYYPKRLSNAELQSLTGG